MPVPWVFYATFAAIVLSWSLSFVSFHDSKNLALWLGGVAIWAVTYYAGRHDLSGFRVYRRCWLALAILLAAGLAVAPAPRHVIDECFRVAGLLLFAGLAYPLARRDVRSFMIVVVGTGAGCALLALFQRLGWLPELFPAFAHYDQRMYSVFGNQGLLGGWMAVCLTAALGLWASGQAGRKRSGAAVYLSLVGLMLSVLLLSGSRAAVCALAAGLFALWACGGARRKRVWGMFALMLAVIAAGIFCLEPGITARWWGALGGEDTGGNFRGWVWGASLHAAGARPWLGSGLGNFSYVAPVYLGAHVPAGLEAVAERTTYHAHFDGLELLVETGALGLLLASWILARIRVRAPLPFAAGIALLVFSCFYPAWYSTPHAVAGLLFLGLNLPEGSGTGCRRVRHACAGAAALAGCVVFVVFALYPSYLLRRAEDFHLSGQPAASAYERAVQAWGSGAEASESRGIYLLESDEPAAAYEALLRARQGIDTGRLYCLLGMAAASAGRTRDACAGYTECLARWPHAREIRARQAIYCGREE